MALTGETISMGLLDAFNEGGRWFVAYPTIAPIMPVTERGGTLQVLPVSASTPPGDVFNIAKTAGAAYTQATGAYTGVPFSTNPVGIEAAIDRSFRLPETAAIDAARQCRRMVDTAIEATVKDAALAESDGFPAVPAGAAWDDEAADPAKDVAAAAAVIRAATGMYPNVLAVSGWAWETLLGCPALRDRLALSVTRGPAEVERALGALLGVDRVVKSTVVGGPPTPAATWPDTTAWVGVCALPGDPPSEPSAMRVAAWTGEGADESGWVVETYYDERTRSDYVRVRGNLGLVVVSEKLGCRITGIKTAPAATNGGSGNQTGGGENPGGDDQGGSSGTGGGETGGNT